VARPAQVLELFVIPVKTAAESAWWSMKSRTRARRHRPALHGPYARPDNRGTLAVFAPVQAGPNSFVLADKLAYCRFSYFTIPLDRNLPPQWTPSWSYSGWPYAVRIEMAPIEPDPSRLQPITVTAPITSIAPGHSICGLLDSAPPQHRSLTFAARKAHRSRER